MDSPLFEIISALTAMIMFLVLLRPQTFRFLMDKGNREPSLGRQGQYVALIVSTWGFVALTLKGNLTEWFFIGYMFAWGAAQFGSLWLKMKGQQIEPKENQP